MSELDKLFESTVDVEKKSEPVKSAKSNKSEKDKTEDLIDSLVKKIEALEKKLEAKEENERGNPANEWAKKMAQEKAARKPKPYKTIYTKKDGKILRIDVKTNGSYSSYVGNDRRHKDKLTPLIIGWKKEGVWVDEYELEEKVKSIMEELIAKGE